MKNLFKRICPLILVFVLLFSVMAVNVSAVSGNSIISFSDKSPKVGDTVTVNVTYKLDGDANAVSGTLTFDSSILKYVSASGCAAGAIDSGVTFNATGNGATYYIRIDLEVIAEGQSPVKVIDGACASDVEGTVEGATAFLTTKNAITEDDEQDLNANTGAALKSITVAAGQLTPAFDPNVTEYKVVVPYTQTDGILSCESLDPNANITVEGSRELKVGNNTRVIVVKSNGQTRRYTIIFNRLDENGNDTTAAPSDIKVTVNNKEYIIGQQDAMLTPPAGFTLSTVMYGENEVSAYKNASGKVVLLYLLAEDGAGDFFLYENGKISDFNYISVGGITYIIKEITEDAPEGMEKSTYELNGKSVSCYKYIDKEFSDFVVFSAISPDGNQSYYSYDVNEKTLQRIVKFTSYEEEASKEIEVSKTAKTVVLSLVSIFVVLLIVLIIALAVKAGRKSGRNVRGIFDTDEDEYEMEEDSDVPDED